MIYHRYAFCKQFPMIMVILTCPILPSPTWHPRLFCISRLISSPGRPRAVGPQLPVLYPQYPHPALRRRLGSQPPQHSPEHQPQHQPQHQLPDSLQQLHRFLGLSLSPLSPAVFGFPGVFLVTQLFLTRNKWFPSKMRYPAFEMMSTYSEKCIVGRKVSYI